MREEGVTEKSPVDTLYWMRESELKHGRVAQLAGQCVYLCVGIRVLWTIILLRAFRVKG